MVEEEDPPPYASLIAISDDAKSILHVDQSTKQFEKFGIKKVPLNGPTMSLRFSNSVLGRILMAKDNVTRAKTQVADLALDLPSGEWICGVLSGFSFLFSRAYRADSFIPPRAHFRLSCVSSTFVFSVLEA